MSTRPSRPGELAEGWGFPLLLPLTLLIIPVTAVSLFIGSRLINPDIVLSDLRDFDPTDNDHPVLRQLRAPHTILAILTGARSPVGPHTGECCPIPRSSPRPCRCPRSHGSSSMTGSWHD